MKLPKLQLKDENAKGTPLSWWAYSMYRECLWSYHQVKIVRRPLPTRRYVDFNTLRGLAVHKGMELYGRHTPLPKCIKGVENEIAIAAEERIWKNRPPDIGPTIRLCTGLFLRARELVESHCGKIVDVEATFSLMSEGIWAKGRIDLITLEDGALVVNDYKTVTSDASLQWQQLRFYARALCSAGSPVAGLRFILPVMNKCEYRKVSEKRQARLTEKLREAIRDIEHRDSNNLDAWPPKPNLYRCRYCAIGATCEYSEAAQLEELSLAEGRVPL